MIFHPKKTAMRYKRFLLIVLLGLISCYSIAQKKQSTFKDTLDGKFDMSHYLVTMHGFVPWPTIISEPALGSFGIGLAAVFMSPKKTAKPGEQFHFPDITAIAGMWTLNNTWGVGLFRQGTFPKIGMRYTVGLGYANANMDYYRTFPYIGEKKFSFKLKPLVAVIDVSENLYKNKIFAGLRYQFTYMECQYKFQNHFLDSLSQTSFDQSKFNKNIGTFGIYAELDFRNTIFTPDRGLRFKSTYTFGRSWTACDEDLNNVEITATYFLPLWKWWICGVKASGVAVNSGLPFWYYPYLDMRGLPMMKYQGQQMLQFETEQRFDVTRRWSVLGFVGTGRTWSDDSKFMSDNTWKWSGGTGFRYLLARVFKLRVGVDVAVGPGQFAYYIVFGHYWNR
jgi:hypothetical protein